jgi:hypothetical protein
MPRDVPIAARSLARRANVGLRPDAVLECEARTIARTLARYGALEERRLFELCSAGSWARGSFGRACDLAVELGWIRKSALGFYVRARRDEQRPSRGDELSTTRRALRSVAGTRARRSRTDRQLTSRRGRGIASGAAAPVERRRRA